MASEPAPLVPVCDACAPDPEAVDEPLPEWLPDAVPVGDPEDLRVGDER
jgi:hypothetical protein